MNRILYAFILCLIVLPGFSNQKIDKDIYYAKQSCRLFHYFEKKYNLPRDILLSIAIQETAKMHPYHNFQLISPFAVNVEGCGYFFREKKEAVAFVYQQLKLGKTSIDVGCMQINLKNHPNAFSSIEQAFDIKSNIHYAARFLASKYAKFKNWETAIGHYHSSTPHLGQKYSKAVIKISENIERYKEPLRSTSVFKDKQLRRIANRSVPNTDHDKYKVRNQGKIAL